MRTINHEIRDLVDQLKSLRKDAGYNQEEFAERIGRHQSSISRFEDFESYPRLDMIRDYLVALDQDIKFVVKPAVPENTYKFTQPATEDGNSNVISHWEPSREHVDS